jgi:hypothetical protein
MSPERYFFIEKIIETFLRFNTEFYENKRQLTTKIMRIIESNKKWFIFELMIWVMPTIPVGSLYLALQTLHLSVYWSYWVKHFVLTKAHGLTIRFGRSSSSQNLYIHRIDIFYIFYIFCHRFVFSFTPFRFVFDFLWFFTTMKIWTIFRTNRTHSLNIMS